MLFVDELVLRKILWKGGDFMIYGMECSKQNQNVCFGNIADNFVNVKHNHNGCLENIKFLNADKFNFSFDIVDVLAERYPNKLAMLHLSNNGEERNFSFSDMKISSNKCANYFTSLGIKKGDKVMLVLKRHYQFWYSILALHKIGAIAIPATNLLQEKDFEYRFNLAGVKAIVCTGDGDVSKKVDIASRNSPTLQVKILVGGNRYGWFDFDSEYTEHSDTYLRNGESPCGDDPMLMFFTSGTTGNPKMAVHNFKYALSHYVTSKYWQGASRDGLHFTISETGWGKALWGKIYGQWLNESPIFTYDFDKFDAKNILPLFKKYKIRSFCAPPTMLRMMIRQDLSKYDLSSIVHMTTAGEAINPEVYTQFKNKTGLCIREGYGQTELTLVIANMIDCEGKAGSMGKVVAPYEVDIVDQNGNILPNGQIGEIVVKTEKKPCGMFNGYYKDEERTYNAWHDGYYHTGDTAWRDDEGYFWYVGRVDDVIKSSGYRIGPFEIESVIMELPYVLECGVSPEPDELRGQVVKASIVLVSGYNPTDELAEEIKEYVKKRTAPYKYPRVVVFRDSLPKTISGKIIRNSL